MRPSWARDIQMEDLRSDTLRELAETIGLEAAMQLAETYGGMVLYVPKADSVLGAVRDRHIRQEYDGTNARKLAIRYNVSESWVNRVANARECFGQTSMFGGGP